MNAFNNNDTAENEKSWIFTKLDKGFRWMLGGVSESTIKELERQNSLLHEIDGNTEASLNGSMSHGLYSVDSSDLEIKKELCLKLNHFDPLVIEAMIGQQIGLGVNYKITNYFLPTQYEMKIWKLQSDLPPLPVNLVFSSYYLHKKALQGSIQISTGTILKAKILCELSSNFHLKGSIFYNYGSIASYLIMKRRAIEFGGSWTGTNGYGVGLKVKHCSHFSNTVGEILLLNQDSIIPRVSINTEGILAAKLASNFGKIKASIKATFNIKDQRFGIKGGFGGY